MIIIIITHLKPKQLANLTPAILAPIEVEKD